VPIASKINDLFSNATLLSFLHDHDKAIPRMATT